MNTETNLTSNRSAVMGYYKRAETGYWNDLGGVCHYGFTPLGDRRPFSMPAAQAEMERILGRSLDLPYGSRVLDAGCGYGPVARRLTEEFGFEVTGIDLMPNRLSQGTRITKAAELPNRVTLANADYHNLPFADESFDGVYTMETLVHASDHRRVLAEFSRVLRPGGHVTFLEYTIPQLETVPRLPRYLAKRVIQNTGMTSLPHFTHGCFPEILAQAGFENVRSIDISKNVYASWYYLWKLAAATTIREFSQGRVSLDNVPGSFWIWPARHRLGYIVNQANKPILSEVSENNLI